MSDIGLIMNGLLGVLLVGALMVGWRLEGRLKALKASHQSFAQAVEDLDRAAGRAEQGLADLRAATDEAADSLAARIEKAKVLSSKLERLTEDAALAEARLAAAPKPAPVREAAPVREPAPSPRETAQVRDTAFARFAERYGATPRTALQARTDLILEDEPEDRASVIARLERLRGLARPAAAATPAPAARAPQARVDDELFERPAQRAGALGSAR
jgi:hypothetical protein